MKKRAIRYLRFSDTKQSHGSIERQELYTDQYIMQNNLELVDTFIDKGHSAKTFDRPDFNKLKEFVVKYHKSVDYLLVDQLDRFSRDAGEAMSYVKLLQMKFNIQVISVTENITFDYQTPGSFFRAGLSLLLAEEDNINRALKINGGIYTAKAKEGRYIHGLPPFGYRKEGDGKAKHLVPHPEEALVVKYIFDAYIKSTPLTIIYQNARKMGLKQSGHMTVQRILNQPLYIGMQDVKPFKSYPGGLFPANHEPILDLATWEMAQIKLKKPLKEKVVVADELPLRGVLRCHCGIHLTGAPSRGKLGKYYYYYKCRESGHMNLSAKIAHEKMEEIQQLMSLPSDVLRDIREKSDEQFEQKIISDKVLLTAKRRELADEENKLESIEEKWITNQINKDTYDRWYRTISAKKISLSASIQLLTQDQNIVYKIIQKNLDKLEDLGHIYKNISVLDKQEMLRQEFDSNLYYQEGMYRTPTMLDFLSHNSQIMRDKGLLDLQEKTGKLSVPPSCGAAGSRTLVRKWSCRAFYMLSDTLIVGA